MENFQNFHTWKMSFWNAYNLFIIEVKGFILGLLVAVCQLKQCISSRVPLNILIKIITLYMIILKEIQCYTKALNWILLNLKPNSLKLFNNLFIMTMN